MKFVCELVSGHVWLCIGREWSWVVVVVVGGREWSCVVVSDLSRLRVVCAVVL